MKGTKVAPRYAKALLELAIDGDQVTAIRNNMIDVLSAIKQSHDLQLLVASPIVRWDKKIAVFRAVFSHFEEMSIQFIELITKKRREYLLPEIAQAYQYQVNQYLGITPVTIVSATTLDEATREAIIEKIRHYVSGTVEITQTIDPELLGGFLIQMNGKQIDASVANQLNQLKQQLAS